MRRPLFVMCLCFVAAAVIWLSLCGSSDKEGAALSLDEGEEVIITGRVYHKNTQNIYLKSVVQFKQSSAAGSRQTIPIHQNIICETEDAVHIPMGSEVMTKGFLYSFDAATNPGEFDTALYYHTQGICGKMKDVSILQCSEDYSLMEECLYRVRLYFKERLYHVFPKKEASVLTAMLLGDKEELDKDVKALYLENGIVHILSISGLHITMIGMGIYRMLRRMRVPIGAAAVGGAVVLLLYGVMTGMSLSACRAIGMYLLRMLALVVGRSYDMLTALGVMAVILVGQNPASLLNAGFLLSFGSIMGIGLLYPAILPEESEGETQSYEEVVWKRRLKKGWKQMRLGLLQSICSGASITLFTLPIQLWFYYEVPTYSVFLNVLVLPFMSILMATGLLAMLLPGAGSIGTAAYLILQGYEWLCVKFSELPLHNWNPGQPMPGMIVVYYVLLGVVILRKRKRLLLLTVAVITMAFKMPTENTVTFLDVGQGDGIVVELESGEVYLFDCGSSSRKDIGEYVLIPFLKSRGISYLDGVFVSHGDEDHCNGIRELLQLGKQKGIRVGGLVLPGIAEGEREREFAGLLQLAEEQSIPVSYIGRGESVCTKTASIRCLHPPKDYSAEDSNAASQCFYIQFGKEKRGRKYSLLLTGDVEGEGESLLKQELERQGIHHATVLKVAHHGSANASSEELLAQLNPRVAVISCGEGNSYGHPHRDTLKRLNAVGSEIVTTPEYGAITIRMGEKVRLESVIPHSSYHSYAPF